MANLRDWLLVARLQLKWLDGKGTSRISMLPYIEKQVIITEEWRYDIWMHTS